MRTGYLGVDHEQQSPIELRSLSTLSCSIIEDEPEEGEVTEGPVKQMVCLSLLGAITIDTVNYPSPTEVENLE